MMKHLFLELKIDIDMVWMLMMMMIDDDLLFLARKVKPGGSTFQPLWVRPLGPVVVWIMGPTD